MFYSSYMILAQVIKLIWWIIMMKWGKEKSATRFFVALKRYAKWSEGSDLRYIFSYLMKIAKAFTYGHNTMAIIFMATILSVIASKKSATLFVFMVDHSTYFGVLDFGMNKGPNILLLSKFFEKSSIFRKNCKKPSWAIIVN